MTSIRDCPSDIQILLVEIDLKKQKWLVVAIYTPPSQCKSYFIIELTKVLNKCRSNFENIVVSGDSNIEPANQTMATFMSDNDFIIIIELNTCFKTSTGTCIDLILTNKPNSFQNTGVIETGASDHHLLIFSFLRTSFTKMPPNKSRCCKYISLDKIEFSKDVSNFP